MAQKEDENEAMYRPKDAIGDGIYATMITGGAGLTISAIQNALVRTNAGPWAVFTRSGGVIGTFVAMGATFGFAESAAANLRERDDMWNPTIAGFLAGSVAGLRMRSFPTTVAYGTGLAVLQGVFNYSGGSLRGLLKDPDMDDYEWKEHMRKNRRRPIQETLNELGEGRGIYGPGYRARRAERIKEAYGIDVPV